MKKIIHVDNSDFFRKHMRTFLQAEGFEVESFDSALDAGLTIGSGSGDMVIMGLTFTEMEGVDFLRKIVEDFSLPIIVVSSSVDKKKAEELIALGAKAALNKSGPWKEDIKPHLSALKGT